MISKKIHSKLEFLSTFQHLLTTANLTLVPWDIIRQSNFKTLNFLLAQEVFTLLLSNMKSYMHLRS
jgi:hypothetical protein